MLDPARSFRTQPSRNTAAVALLGALLFAGCGSSAPRLAPTGSVCDPSDPDSLCESGLCVALDSSSGFCTDSCSSDDECPDDFLCQAAGRYGRICRPLSGCSKEQDCPSGHTCNEATGNCYIAVSRTLCSPCQDSLQCPNGGTCYQAAGSREQFCTTACVAGQCPSGFTCRELAIDAAGATAPQCVPVAETCNNGRPLCAPCQGDRECGGPFDLCVRNVVSQETFCGRDCNPEKNVCPTLGCDPAALASAENPDCPTGFSCTNLGETPQSPHQCVPNSNSCIGFCDATDEQGQLSQCGLGKVCSANVCTNATDGRMCSSCTDNDDCRAGGFSENRCIVNTCTDCANAGESFCSTPCASDEACERSFGVGFACRPVFDSSGVQRSYCMPDRGSCRGGSKRLGDDCITSGAQECVSGLCLLSDIHAFCSAACVKDADCKDGQFRCCARSPSTGGYDCSEAFRAGDGPLGGAGVCAPLGGLFGDDCSPGQPPCQSGTCLDLGTARLCSKTCPTGECPVGFSCRDAVGDDGTGSLSVCFPSGGGVAGSSCDFGPAACGSGLCIRKESGAICTSACSADSDCPESWICDLLPSVTGQSVQACLPPALQDG